jgi:phosphatidylserine/phosphatidylglycerophosphate/cardiolipin synthase-like enzyme
MPEGFHAAAEALLDRLSPAVVRHLAAHVEAGLSTELIVHGLDPEASGPVARMLSAMAIEQVPGPVAASYLRGLASGYARQEARCEVEIVWSGPSAHHVPVRATGPALLSVIAAASRELLLMTYSAKPHPPILEALAAAGSRGVATSVVVETLQGAGSAISGAEPAAAFIGIAGLAVWHWPSAKRQELGAKQHAKLAVADARTLLVTSANLTASGIGKNIEAGLLVRGGTAPQRASEHIRALQSSGTLARLF